jgi:hypothetical protein
MKNTTPRVRKNEVIGGGFFVFRRGKSTGCIGCGTTLPFEHGSFESAAQEAKRLAETYPGETFSVFEEMQSYSINTIKKDWCDCAKKFVDRCVCMGD